MNVIEHVVESDGHQIIKDKIERQVWKVASVLSLSIQNTKTIQLLYT